ncbi:MAG: WYL domain-containing protein [Ruminococcus flavefaciens]|nr:WYL domain-containing protein [Ruminococcus flavefaciens]MCM1230613.1 WYL domain-containing protein [Ruminococcus flavefaciens]
MEQNKNNRIMEIFFRALRGETISVRKIAGEFNVSTKSIGRDISVIQQFLSENRELMQNAELVYSYKDKAYVLNSDEFLKNKELFALIKVMLGCRCFSKEEVITLISKLKRFTTVQDRKLLENLIHKEIYHYHEVKSDCAGVIDNIWKIVRAIEEKNIITITYYKMNRSEVRHRIIPASVMFSEYYFYLIAYKVGDESYKPIYFRIDRISAITENREKFLLERRYDFDEGDLREKNQFMFPGENEKIRFEFSGPSLQAVLDRLPTAKVVDKKGGTSIIEAEINHGRGIVMYLLSQGSWVKVLSPKSLADEIRDEAEKIAYCYKQTDSVDFC